MFRKIIMHLNNGLVLALITVVIVGYFNPFMGFTRGREFIVLLSCTIVVSIINVISFMIYKKTNKTFSK